MLDLCFEGALIGEGGTKNAHLPTRGLEVKIYKTKKGNFVAHTYHWTRWQGERSTSMAGYFETPDEVYDFLVDDFDGENLGNASKEAWEEACDSGEFGDASKYEEVE